MRRGLTLLPTNDRGAMAASSAPAGKAARTAPGPDQIPAGVDLRPGVLTIAAVVTMTARLHQTTKAGPLPMVAG